MLLLSFSLALVLFFACYLIRNYVAVSPSIPGPFIARFTDFWRAYYQFSGQLRPKLISLHAQHGDVVRYGIKSISISDYRAIETLYESRDPFLIAYSYDPLVGIANGKEVLSLITMRNESRHAQLRRSIASVFTVRGAEAYADHVNATIPDLLNALDRKLSHSIDLTDLFSLYSVDSAAHMAFSESLGCLDTGKDNGGLIKLVRERLQHWGWWASVPWLERLVYRNPFAFRQTQGKAPNATVRTAILKLQTRMKEKDPVNPDMLSRFMSAHETEPGHFNEQDIVALLMSTITGASETTATTLTAAFFYLLSNPRDLERLRSELAELGAGAGVIPSIETTSKTPYLDAVIKETMRLFPIMTLPLERLVPQGGRIIAGRYYPEGTSVGIFAPALHLNRHIYGEDAEEYRPRRWIEASAENLKSMDRAFMSFSRGKRVCLGQHVAMMQMRKVISVLVTSYDMELVNKHTQLEGDMSSASVWLKPLSVVVKSRS